MMLGSALEGVRRNQRKARVGAALTRPGARRSVLSVDRANTPFFGRASELQYLRERAQRKGLTAVTGLAQVGKSRLLRELRDSLDPATAIVGYAESTGERSDLLLRAVAAAYAAASLDERAEIALRAAASDLMSVSTAVLEAVLPSTLKSIPGLIRRASDSIATGGLVLPTLSYDEALRLVKALANATACPVILVLDAWQDSDSLDQTAAPLRHFVDHIDDWPTCHVFLGMRTGEDPGDKSVQILSDIIQRSSSARLLPLGPMECDSTETGRLLSYLSDVAPATTAAGPSTTLDLLGGHPGVLDRWVREQPETTRDLIRQAAEALGYQYSDLFAVLEKFGRESPATTRFLARVALLPPVNDVIVWEQFRPFMVEGISADEVLRLQAEGVLHVEDASPDIPSYGHATRRSAARRYWLSNKRLLGYARREAGTLIPQLAENLRTTDWHGWPLVAALMSLLSVESSLQLSDVNLALCISAAQLAETVNVEFDEDWLLQMSSVVVKAHPSSAALLAMALNNLAVRAEKDDRHAFIYAVREQLRILAGADPDHAGPFYASRLLIDQINAHEADDFEHTIVAVEELRTLVENCTQSEQPRKKLAQALYNARNYAAANGEPELRDRLLAELRDLATAYPDDARIHSELAEALLMARNDAAEEGNLARRDSLLEELRVLAADHPDETSPVVQLAMALNNARLDKRPAAERRDLLDEFRKVASDHPHEPRVHEFLARSLANDWLYKVNPRTTRQRAALLKEVSRIASLPEQAESRGFFVALLVKAQAEAVEENDSASQERVLEELRQLVADHADEPDVVEGFCSAVLDAEEAARKEGDTKRAGRYLDEIRRQVQQHPSDESLLERFARALARADCHARETNLPADDRLLNELRQLAETHPGNSNLRAILAASLCLAHASDPPNENAAQRDATLEELRRLSREHADEEGLLLPFACALLYSAVVAHSLEEEELWNALAGELVQLASAHPANAEVGAIAKRWIRVRKPDDASRSADTEGQSGSP